MWIQRHTHNYFSIAFFEIKILFLNVNMNFNVFILKNHPITWISIFPNIDLWLLLCPLTIILHAGDKKNYIGLCACIVGKHTTTETLSFWHLNFFYYPPSHFLLVCFKKVAFKLTGVKQETFDTSLKVLRSQGWMCHHASSHTSSFINVIKDLLGILSM